MGTYRPTRGYYARHTEPVTAADVAGWQECHCDLIAGMHLVYEHDLAQAAPETEVGS